MKSAAMPTLPALKQPGGKIMCETEDIMKHFATLGGKLLVDAKQAELARIGNTPPLQMCDPLWNLPPPMHEQFGIMAFDKWVEAVTPIFKDLASKLGDGPYFGGATPGYGECYTWHNVDVSFKLAKAELTKAVGEADVQKLEAWYKKFAELPGVKEYLAERPKQWGMPGSKAHPA
uniref:Glutathione S-transferase C-terminal domain-containing protein n=1 Tax=Prymnesium polylepis TaxID=72548 RepID=A0A7S4HZD7_9EUKA|mmetsp:Transcript_24340/g.60491  ORF Transcript_24340/g.60491 Transcript_24340/m.60491 type:complete len:175 (+) Transcript_24340:244-768(+)